MSELWNVYTKDRKRTQKRCVRGEQGNLLEDEFHLWVMVWIKNPQTGKYLVSQRSADKEVDPLKWETVAGHAILGESSLDTALRYIIAMMTGKPNGLWFPAMRKEICAKEWIFRGMMKFMRRLHFRNNFSVGYW